MRRSIACLGLFGVCLASLTLSSNAASIPGLYNSGVNDSGQLLANGAVDPHFRLVQSPDAGSPGPNAFVITDTLFPIVGTGPWLASGPSSKWIGPMANQSTGSAAGDYRYRTTFNLTGLDPTTAVITGRWTSDNGGVDIFINGQGTGLTYDGNFGVFSAVWTINSGFVEGSNTLDFVINNAGTTANPTGIRIELSGTADLPPPPGTPPTITRQPVNQTVPLLDPATFSVSATGSRPLLYQWRFNGAPIGGATNAIYTVASATVAVVGSYDVIVNNDGGTVTSMSATLNVQFQRPGRAPYEPLGPASRRTGLVFSEIMYHPPARPDERNGEFIEIHNSNPYFEDISGWRLSGELDFVFPSNTVVPANGFVLVAPAPADVTAIHGVTGVLGGSTNKLANAGGTIRLLKRSGAVVLELEYSDQSPWPVAADGTGHSLVLGRPSYGQADAKAWTASAFIGGSPGAADPVPDALVENVVINEILAHTDLPLVDYVELFNFSPFTVDLSGCFLSDDPATNKFRFPAGTTLPPRGHLVIEETQLGFGLESDGETVYFVNAATNRVIDAVRFGGQANGISSGRHPDGAPSWTPLAARSPGTANSPELVSSVVINEIMYKPISGDSDDEYVELHNRGGLAVNVGGWKLGDGISYTIPDGTMIPANGYLVVAEDAARLRTNYPALNSALIVGNYNGSLANGGERITLAMPDSNLSTNLTTGLVTTNLFAIVVDEVTYGVGGRWGRWADGGGSSLELIERRGNHRVAPNWADSDESAKAPWTVVEATGPLDLGFTGMTGADQLQVMLMGPGEALIDNVEVLVAGANRIANPGFEGSTAGWFFQGTHSKSTLDTTGGFESARSLRVVASERGDHVANRVRAPLSASIPSGTMVTLRARVRWLKGHPEILLRLRGGWLEAYGRLNVPANLGTPGAANSRAAANAGPAITDVTHRPLLPGAGQNIRVTARLDDPDGIQTVNLRYRLDPGAAVSTVAMVDDGSGSDAIAGDGIYTGVIPGQPVGTLAFNVQATDRFATPGATLFPNDAPRRECLVRVGEFVPPGQFGTYRLWLTAASVNTWASREKMSNEDLDGTFVYGNRAIYNVGGHYSGSSYTAPIYTSPVGALCGYDINFPEDDRLLSDSHFTLDWPIRDATDQREQLMYWFLEQYGLPNMYRRYVHLFVNGVRRGTIYDDIQQPGGDAIEEFFPGDADGSLWKTDCWNEFTDAGDRVDPCILNSLEIFTSAGGKKTARYRWNWRPRAVGGTANDFTDLFALVDVMNAPASAYQSSVNGLVDMEHWMRTFAMNDLASFWDAFGNPNAKNTYLYKPERDGWKLFSWDFDVGLGVFNDPVNAALFPSLGDPTMNKLWATPAFVRGYWRALDEAVNSFFQAGVVTPLLAAKYNALQADGINLTSPFAVSGAFGLSITDWIAQRRNFLLSQLATVTSPYAITSATNIVTGTNLLRITGTAPIAARDLTFNGIPYPLQWTSVSNWIAWVPVTADTTALAVSARSVSGQILPNTTRIIQVDYTGVDESPETNVVINEIMYNPATPEATFVELYNRSTRYAFDLSGWGLNGVDYEFPPGTILSNGGFLVLAKSREAFATAYGAGIPVIGVFDGQLDDGGETLTLLRPSASQGTVALVDRVTYDDDPPWPASADGLGTSLQLVDAAQDNARASNWSDGAGWQFFSFTGSVGSSGLTRLSFYFETSGGDVYLDDVALVLGSVPGEGVNVLANGGFESGLTPWVRGPLATNSEVASGIARSGAASLHLIITNGGAALTTFYQDFPAVTPASVYTVSFWFLVGGKGTNLNVRMNTLFRGLATTVSARYTPGAPNGGLTTLPAFPSLWISEVQPANVSTIADQAGEFEPWIEIYNSGLLPLSLDGVYLANSYADLRAWPFPAGMTVNTGQYLLVWADGESGESTPGSLHANFRLNATNGSVVLSRDAAGAAQILDYVNYTVVGANRSIGSFPAGTTGGRDILYYATPGTTNNPAAPPVPLFINEWMASNAGFIADPADGNFDDWFEIYNPGAVDIDLSRYRLTDDPAHRNKFTVPVGIRVPAGGYLLVWADENTGQTRTNGDLHVNFRLSLSGEYIGLEDPEGRLVDSVMFGTQTANVTQGRFPNGAPAPFVTLSTPTPRGANLLSTGGPEIGTAEVTSGNLLRLTWSATPGRSYRVQYKNNLYDSEWMDLPGDVTAAGSAASHTDVITGDRRFYRVQELP